MNQRVFAYLRVSTEKQDEAGQRLAIENMASQKHLIVSEWYSDTESGGVPWQERGLAKVLENTKKGDIILVSEITRIARSTLGVLTFMEAVVNKGVQVFDAQLIIKLDGSAMDKLTITLFAMIGEVERNLLRVRTKNALAAKKAAGVVLGRPRGANGKEGVLDGKEEEIQAFLYGSDPRSKTWVAARLGVTRPTLDLKLKKMKGY